MVVLGAQGCGEIGLVGTVSEWWYLGHKDVGK